MRYLSVCSGIEAASVAWAPLGWSAVAVAEVDPFPCALLAQHYPAVPNWGDLTRFQEWPDATVDVLVGGTPCQSFSVAGLRAGLDDPRGSLLLAYLAVARRYRPRWLVWENVPGVLSVDEGRAFGALLGGLAQLGYGFAYRVLDAQYFGLAQRRQRVFVVGHLGDWRRAAAVLFERESLSGHPAPRREAGQAAPTLPSRRTAGGGLGTDFNYDGGLVPEAFSIAPGHCGTPGEQDNIYVSRIDVARTLDCTAADPSRTQGGVAVAVHVPAISPAIKARDYKGVSSDGDGDGDGVPLIAFDTTQITSKANRCNPQPGDPCHPLAAGAHPPAIAFPIDLRNATREDDAVGVGTPSTGIGAVDDPGFAVTSVPQAVAFDARQSDVIQYGDQSGPLDTDGHSVAVAFVERGRADGRALECQADLAYSQQARSGGGATDRFSIMTPAMSVRRLTPRECERLQGFPDDYTLIRYRGKPAADGPRYKALGNSMAVPVMRWIGQRIALVEAIP